MIRINSHIQTVTPDLARLWLDKNMDNQRKLDQNKIRRLATMMQSGQWLIATAIYFDYDDRMINGQHRLHAVVQADVAVDFLILEGFHPDAAGVIDQSTRSGRQVLQILSGDQGVKYGNEKMAVARDMKRAYFGDLDKIYHGNGNLKTETPDLARWVIRNEDVLNHYAPIASGLRAKQKLDCLVKPSAAMYVLMMLHKMSPTATAIFVDYIQSAERTGLRDPRLQFKAAFDRKVRLEHDQDIALLIMLWNDWATGNGSNRRSYLAPTWALGAPMPKPVLI